MLNLLVHFLLSLHLLHVCERENRVRYSSCGTLALGLQTSGARCEDSHRLLLSVQHVLLCEESQAVFECPLAGALLLRHAERPVRKWQSYC